MKDGEDFGSVAAKYGISDPWELILYNFHTRDVREINWYLRERVGCDVSTADRKNWLFTSSARPGIIYVPSDERNSPLANDLEKTWAGAGFLFGAHVGLGGRRVGLFKLWNVEALVRGIPIDFTLQISYTLSGVGIGLSVQQALIVAAGIKSPSKINGMVLTGGRVNFDFFTEPGAVRKRINRAVDFVKDNVKTQGRVFFSRDQFNKWMKQLDINIHTQKPRVHVIGETIAGVDVSAAISVGRAQIIA